MAVPLLTLAAIIAIFAVAVAWALIAWAADIWRPEPREASKAATAADPDTQQVRP